MHPNETSDEHDARLLNELAEAVGAGDGGLRVQMLRADLLAYYWPYILRVAELELWNHFPPTKDDVHEVGGAVILRLAGVLERKQKFDKPFGKVVLDNIKWECADHRRRYTRRLKEIPHAVDEVEPVDAALGRKRSVEGGARGPIRQQHDDGPDPTGLPAQARAFGPRIVSLPERDRTILAKRFVADVPPDQIAADLGIRRGAIDTATARALRKAENSDELADVRNRRRRTEGGA